MADQSQKVEARRKRECFATPLQGNDMLAGLPEATGLRSAQFFLGRYACGWFVAFLIVFVDAIWLSTSRYSVQTDAVITCLKAAGALMFGAVLLNMIARIPRYKSIAKKLRYNEAAETAAWFALILCFVSATCILSYLCVTLDAPLIDESLIRFDHQIGFDWEEAYRWVRSHPDVQHVFEFAYGSGTWELIGVPLLLGLTGRREALSEFVLILIISSVLLLLLSTPFPATSAFIFFNVTDPNTIETVSDFSALRNCTMHIFDIAHAQGLVSLPSFHTALAVFFMYSLRNVPILLPLSIVLNMTMILATPTQGGHYLVDVLAGLILAFLSIKIFEFARERVCYLRPSLIVL